MSIILGKNEQGEELLYDFYENLLIGGGTGSGKTTLVHNIIDCAISRKSDHIRFIIADNKSVSEYASYADNPQVEILSIVDCESFKKKLEFVENEIFYRSNANECEDYEEYVSLITNHDTRRIIFVIDEFSDIMRIDREYFEVHLRKIIQLGEETGISVIALTQCVNESIVTDNILEMFPRRIFLGYGDIESNKSAYVLLHGK